MNLSLRLETRFWIALVLTVALFFIAASIGSGWMFLLADALLAAIVCAAIMPLLCLSNVVVKQQNPHSLTAGERFPVQVVLSPRQGKGGIMPPQLLLIDCRRAGKTVEAAHTPRVRSRDPWASMARPCQERDFGITPGKAGGGVGGREHAQGMPYERCTAAPLLVESLDHQATLSFDCPGLPRGLHQAGDVAIATAFPLGLIFYERKFACKDTLTVYPETRPMEGFFLYRIKSLGYGSCGTAKEGSSAQSIFTRGVREYVRGDSPRIIHWMSTARTGRLMVREFDAEGLPQFDVALDLLAPWQSPEQFELAITVVSSLLSLGQRTRLAPELKLNPSLLELDLNLPQTLPGYDQQMEILSRVNPRGASAPAGRQGTSVIGNPFDQSRSLKRTLVIVCPAGTLEDEPLNSFIIEVGTAPADGGSELLLHSSRTPGTARAPGHGRVLIASLEDIANL